MKDRFNLYLDLVRTSFWAIPVTLLLLATSLSFINLWLDSQVFPKLELNINKWVDLSSVSDVRSTLTSTAAAILGVAGVSFSITIASLTLASQQFGPRLIRTFLQDRFTQTVLGFFVATFFYCMLSVHLHSIMASDYYLPLSLLATVIVLTLVDLVLLVLFIHHIAVSIQVNSVIAEVSGEMQSRAREICEHYDEDFDQDKLDTDRKNLEQRFSTDRITIASSKDGYVQIIDYDQLITFATQANLNINILTRAGSHVLLGQTVACVLGPYDDLLELQDKINANFVMGKTRNPAQDLEFSIRQLVEIGLRALSPGINDPFTAISCIDRLGTLINFVMSQKLPQPVIYDADNTPRLLIDVSTFDGIVDASFNQIRQNAFDSVDVQLHLLELLTRLIELTDNIEQAKPLYNQASWVIDRITTTNLIEADRQVVDERFAILKEHFACRYALSGHNDTNKVAKN